MADTGSFQLSWTPFLRKQRGRMFQAVGLTFPAMPAPSPVPQPHPNGELILLAGSRKYMARTADLLTYPDGFHGRDGQATCLWLIPRPARPVRCRAVWKAPFGGTYKAQLTLKPADLVRVYVVLDAHLDVGQGRAAWNLMPFTTHSELLGFEDLCRSIYAARRLAERYGRPVPRAARLTGVPAHTASLAQVLTAAGCTFIQIGAPPDSRLPDVPPMFWWKLPDGKRVLVHYQRGCETPLLPPEDWPWREWLSVQTAGEAVRHLDWIERHFHYPDCRVERLEDFGDAFARRHGKEIPVVDKELTDSTIFGIAGQTRAAASIRRDRDRLASAEALGTLAAWASAKVPKRRTRQEQTGAGFQSLARYTEHGVRAQDRARLAEAAHECTVRIESLALAGFAGRLASRQRQPLPYERGPVRYGRGCESSIVLFNTLSWPRGGVVHVGADGLPPGEFELIDAATGGAVVYERTGAGLEFVAPPVPACGYLVLELLRAAQRSRPGSPADWEERNLSLHTNQTTLQFHTAGGLCRWHDRRLSVQWCSGTAEYPTGAYVYEMPGGDDVRALAGRAGARVHPEITPLYSRIVVEAGRPPRRSPGRGSGNACGCRLAYTLYHRRPELHLNLRLFGKTATGAAAAGYAVFPFAVDDPHVLVDRIAQLTTPADDLAAGANAAYMAVHHGVRIEGDHAGMNFYPLDTPLVAFGSPGTHRRDPGDACSNGTLYATLFNRVSGPGAAKQRSGDLSFDFVLHPTPCDGWDGGLAKGGMEYFRPLLAAAVNGRPGVPAASLLAVDPPAVQLVALKPADFEPGYVLRLWNSLLGPVEARLALPAVRRGDELWQCDLLERTVRRVAIDSNGQARLKLRPHEIATLLLLRP